MRHSRASALAVAIVGVVGLAYAADQTILGKQEQIKDPRAGVDPYKRKLIAQGQEKHSPNTIVGDPTQGGATLTLFANGATSSNQVFVLPSLYWSAVGTGRFKYKTPGNLGSGATRASAEIQLASSGTFKIKTVVTGNVPVVPPNPGTDGCAVLEIAGGDRYHMLFGPGSTIKKNDVKTFMITKPPTEGLCPSTTTTSTTVTSTSTSSTSSTSTSSTSSTSTTSTSSTTSTTPPQLPWVATGTAGDCPGGDIAPLTDTDVPDPANCVPATQGLAAVCWDGVTYSNPNFAGQAKCTYKSSTPANCTGGAAPGYMYSCEPF